MSKRRKHRVSHRRTSSPRQSERWWSSPFRPIRSTSRRGACRSLWSRFRFHPEQHCAFPLDSQCGFRVDDRHPVRCGNCRELSRRLFDVYVRNVIWIAGDHLTLILPKGSFLVSGERKKDTHYFAELTAYSFLLYRLLHISTSAMVLSA